MITRDCRGSVGVNGAWEGPACASAVNTRLLVAERRGRWVAGRNVSVCGVTSGDHYIQSEERRKWRAIEIDGTRLLPYSFE